MKFANRCFKGIEEMPMMNWHKFNNSGDYRHLFKDKKAPKKYSSQANEYYLKLQQQIIDSFGLDSAYINVMRLKCKLACHKIDLMVTGNQIHEIFADKTQQDISEALKGGISFGEQVAYVSRFMGFNVDPHNVSVSQFYGYISIINSSNVRPN